MMIDKITGITQLLNTQKAKKPTESQNVFDTHDTINVSDTAKEKATLYYMNEVAKSTPDVRADRVAELKQKIQDPNYLNSVLYGKTAEKIMEAYGI